MREISVDAIFSSKFNRSLIGAAFLCLLLFLLLLNSIHFDWCCSDDKFIIICKREEERRKPNSVIFLRSDIVASQLCLGLCNFVCEWRVMTEWNNVLQ